MSCILPKKIELSRNSGFATILALSLMAFVLLLILSLSSLIWVEQQAADKARSKLLAQQNALTALHVAIGDLQRYLGPDKRATASADILDSANNPYTLVWHSDPTKSWDIAIKDWSDSGDTADFALPLLSVDPAKLDTLIDNGTFNESVLDNSGGPSIGLMKISNPNTGELKSLKAEKRPMINTDGAIVGSYAWVAQDESLKANLKTEHGDYQNTDSSLDLVETSRRLSVFPYANAAGIEIEGALPFGEIEPVVNGELNADYFEKIQKADNIGDLITSGLLTPANKSGSNAEQLAAYRNHFTLNSKGVLADAKNGGLRRDLSRGLDDQYFEKLHGVPVFGVDRNGNVVADGVNEPVGDQWKFFRDYYNFYRPVDDILAKNISAENQHFGLDDVTDYEPSTRMRFTNQIVARNINHLFPRSFSPARARIRSYEGIITPTVLTNQNYNDNNSNDQNVTINANSWNLFTPQLRPVVIRNSLKIAIKPVLYTSDDTSDLNNGKYYLEFEVYPTFTIWNPFNVAIELDHGFTSINPFANGYEMWIYQSGNIELEIDVLDIDGNNRTESYLLSTISPNVALFNPNSLQEELGRTSIPPGAVLICGLKQNYYASRNNYNPQYYSSPSLTGQGTVSIELGIGTQINEDYCITYADDTYSINNGWERVYYDGSDILTLNPLNYGTDNDVYQWLGQIKSYKLSGGDTRCDSFFQGENPNVYGTSPNATPLQEVSVLASSAPWPLDAIDIRARTITNNSDNPAFPVFAQMNLMGTYPQVVREDGDVNGDVKILYISSLIDSAQSDPIEGRGSDGYAHYGSSFLAGEGSNKIILYDLPRHPIVSLGDFKNLVISWNEDAPPRPIGASWPIGTIADLSKTYITSGSSESQYSIGAGCDTSYHYNSTLFDSYFFSGALSADRDEDSTLLSQTFPYEQILSNDYILENSPLANTQLVYYNNPTVTEIREQTTSDNGLQADAFEAAAGHLLIDSPFNINSTSAKAWQAVLSGFRKQSIAGVNYNANGVKLYRGDGSAFVDHFVPSGESDELYIGHRRLDDSQLESLSENLVEEIRERGAAKSLGEFLNRDLLGNNENQQMSRTDEAIQKSGINANEQTVSQIQSNDLYAIETPSYTASAAHMFGKNLVKDAGAGLPGYFKQQDIVRPLAPIMTTRGDTFVIRAYGESVDPITQQIIGRAWCEVTIQRVPDYVDEATPAWIFPPNNEKNSKFGRRLTIINFRWLKDGDINT